MARMAMDSGATPMSYFAPSPYAVPAKQAPYYVIPQPAHSIPQYSAAPHYVYNPSPAFNEYGQSNGSPIFKVVPSQKHQHQYPIYNAVPADMSKKDVTFQESLENALREQKQPKAHRVQHVPQSSVAPNAPHPVYVVPDGSTMLGQPAHYNGYPVYRVEDAGDMNRLHLHYGALGNQQPSEVHYVNNHGIPFAASTNKFATGESPVVRESQPYGLPAAQPGMRWKLVPIADPDVENAATGVVPNANPKASCAPLMLLKSPGVDNASSNIHSPNAEPLGLKLMPENEGDNAISSESDDPYKQFLSLLFPKLEQTKDNEDSEATSKVAPANSVVPEMEVKATTPKSVRIIPVTDPPKDEERVVPALKEKNCSETDTKVGPAPFVKRQPKRSSAPALKPIKLVPSLDFVKKDKYVAGSKQEKQDTQDNQGKADSHQVSAEENLERVLIAKTHDEVGPKVEVENVKRAREKSVEGLSDVESNAIHLEKGDEHSAKKMRLVTDNETAARLIQSVYKGYLVRRCQPLKHLRDIARVESLLKDYQVLVADRSTLEEKCRDPAERTTISEGIMSLLLQLDVIQGVDPVVRDIRKCTSKEVLKLQSEVDAAMALISVTPEAVSKESDQATALNMLYDETTVVGENLAMISEIPDESVERHHAISTNGHETVVSTSEGIAAKNDQPTAQPVEQPEERVEDLLRKLLNKLPESGGCKEFEAVDVGESLNTHDLALISEVVKRLSILEEQQRDRNSSTRRLNEPELPTVPSAHGQIDEQEESEMSNMGASESGSDEVLHLISTTLEDLGGENKLPTSELATSPTKMELQNLVETVAANFVDAVLTHTEDSIGLMQSTVNNAENIVQGQDFRDTNNTTLHEVTDTGIGLSQPASVDVSNEMAETPKLVNVEEKFERSYLTPNEVAGGLETQREDTSGILIASEVDHDGEWPTAEGANQPEDDEEGLQIMCRSECATNNQRIVFSTDGPTFGSGKNICQEIQTGDGKEQTSELGAHEECSKVSFVVEIEAADEEATSLDSTKSPVDEEEVQNIDLEDVALQQLAPAEVACDSSTRATLSLYNENTNNEEAVEVEVEVEDDNVLASPSYLTHCSIAGNPVSLWNGSSTCQDSHDVRSRLQSVVQGSEVVTDACLGMDEPSDCDQQPGTANGFDQSLVNQSDDASEKMKVQIPDKSSSQGKTVEPVDSPTSVLDVVVSLVPAEDLLSVAEMALDDTTSKQPSMVTTGDNPEGTPETPNSSVYEEAVLQVESAISNLESLSNEREFFLNDQSLQLESAIPDLQSLNNTGQGFLNDLSPEEDHRYKNSVVRWSSLKRIAEEMYILNPPSLSPEALQLLEGGVCEGLPPSGASSPSSEVQLTLTQHLIEENTILKELVKDVLKWSQWQSSATLSLHKMMEKLALEVLETKTTAKRAVKGRQGRYKHAAKKKLHRV